VILNALRGDLVTFALPVPDTVDETADITFMVKRHLMDLDADAVIAKSGLSVAEGVVAVALTPEDTDAFADADRLYWDLQFDDGIGGVQTPLRGKLVIAADVSVTASATS
jgi:hypothetical protein